MKPTINVEISPWSIVLTLALLVGLYAVSQIPGILVLLMISLILTAAMRPGVTYLERHHLPRWAAVTLMFTLGLGALALLGAFVFPALATQGAELLQSFPRYVERLEASYAWAEQLQERFAFVPDLEALASQVSQAATTWIASSVGLVGQAFGAALDVMVILVVTFFLLLEGPKLKRGFLSLVPPGHRAKLDAQFDPVAQKLGAYVSGISISMAFLATFLAIALSIAGVPLALALALLAGVLEIIPIIGPLVATVPAVVLALTVSWQLALVVLAIYGVAQLIQNNVIAPVVFSRSIELSPVIVTFALLIGAELMGVAGAIIAVPLVAAIQVLVENLYVKPMEARSHLTSTPLMTDVDAADRATRSNE